MAETRIESLLRAAHSSPDQDSSVNGAKRIFIDENEARAFYSESSDRMLRIEEWQKSSSVTDYHLFEESGRPVDSDPISVGKFIQIALYGTGKYDWVQVDEIVDAADERIIVVRPSHDPTNPEERDKTSHFFWPEARNNFCLQLNETKVAFYVIGLHEKQNTEFTAGLIESARNAAVANVGYYSGLQKAVWKEFSQRFLQNE